MRGFQNSNILFMIPDQFGYSAGYYYYCKYLLLLGYNITVICVDKGLKKVELDGAITFYYIQQERTRINKFLYVILVRLKSLKKLYNLKNKGDIFILKYFEGVSISLLFLPRNRTIVDIRTGTVRKSKTIRILLNQLLRVEVFLFKKIFILSKELSQKLKLASDKIIYLPLGSEELSKEAKNYCSSINLLYIGTFSYRNIDQCIDGFAKFYKKYKALLPLSFDIIGFGKLQDEAKIKELIYAYNLSDVIVFHGKKTHVNSLPFFQRCNYGISYIPITDYFNLQPPTKTFEYILSGLVCIATQTKANQELITEKNGVLCEDTSESFFHALETVYNKRFSYSTDAIKDSLYSHKWEYIVRNIMHKAFKEILLQYS
ncbi:MAG TPA: hypothetical protein DIC46_00580 [Porphyromonadaceae bacterium]|jgi:hypothetical protein|nr:hypothetical protein [Porphyromonadaceae bacterium]